MEEKFEVKGEWYFTQVDNVIFNDERVTAIEQSVYAALCNFANIHDERKSFPGYPLLMKKAHINSRTTLSKSLAHLEEYGFIKVERTPGGHNIYRVWMLTSPPTVLPSPSNGLHPSTRCTVTRASELEKKNNNVSTNVESASADNTHLIKNLSKEEKTTLFNGTGASP